MKPYYQDEWVTIYLGDCRVILPQLDVKVDLVLTDPPYGLGHRLHDGGTWSTNPIYDAVLEWDIAPVENDLIIQVIGKGISAIVWGGNNYQLPTSRCWLSWIKKEAMPTLADFELAWTNFDKPSKCWIERRNPDGKRQHPTQKPVSLLSWCILQAYNPQSILDPFMGSGSTLLAAKKLNRHCIGIEIEERYCEIAAKRCSQQVFDLAGIS